MGESIGGCRFKVEEVNNGWVIEFMPRLDADPNLDRKLQAQSRLQKHVAPSEAESLLYVIHQLLIEQDPPDQDDEPTASQPEDE